MQLILDTYRDMVDRALDYVGGASDPKSERNARRAVLDAWNEMRRHWTYFYSTYRISTVAPYLTGTVAYDHTGGAVERQLTLTGGTWPTWAADGVVGFNNDTYSVASRISDTVLRLAVNSNPGADTASGLSYQLWRDTYPLPVDFVSMGEVSNDTTVLNYSTPGDIVARQRSSSTPGSLSCFTIKGDPRRYGALAIQFLPAPDSAASVNFSYQRRPRQMNVLGYTTGTVSTTSGLTTLTGSGTTFNASMVGAVIRLAENSLAVPTGPDGASPFYLERTVAAYTDATTLALDADPGVTLSGVAYCISDPLDIEPGAMRNYFVREVERQMRMLLRMEPTSTEERQYTQTLLAAKEMDARSHARRAVFEGRTSYFDPRVMPAGADQG